MEEARIRMIIKFDDVMERTVNMHEDNQKSQQVIAMVEPKKMKRITETPLDLDLKIRHRKKRRILAVVHTQNA